MEEPNSIIQSPNFDESCEGSILYTKIRKYDIKVVICPFIKFYKFNFECSNSRKEEGVSKIKEWEA